MLSMALPLDCCALAMLPAAVASGVSESSRTRFLPADANDDSHHMDGKDYITFSHQLADDIW